MEVEFSRKFYLVNILAGVAWNLDLNKFNTIKLKLSARVIFFFDPIDLGKLCSSLKSWRKSLLRMKIYMYDCIQRYKVCEEGTFSNISL